jgi:cytochrome c biogenesis protein CcdA
MEPQLIVVSFIAGILTILAPCILPLLPILLGTSADSEKKRNRATVVIASLLVSITVLTLLIHGTSNFFNIDTGVLRAFSAVIITVVGVVMLFPHIWEKISAALKLNSSSNKLLGKAMSKDGTLGAVLIGAALAPVFSSCSPTYGIIIASILPQNFATGAFYLLWYILGLGIVLALIAVLGRKFISKIGWATDPNGWFKRAVGALFLIIGIAVMFNLDKSFEIWVLQLDFYNNLVNFELNLNR